VEAGGQYLRGFRHGLDYAFNHACCMHAWVRSVLSSCTVPA